jgi:hypothetical protein
VGVLSGAAFESLEPQAADRRSRVDRMSSQSVRYTFFFTPHLRTGQFLQSGLIRLTDHQL